MANYQSVNKYGYINVYVPYALGGFFVLKL